MLLEEAFELVAYVQLMQQHVPLQALDIYQLPHSLVALDIGEALSFLRCYGTLKQIEAMYLRKRVRLIEQRQFREKERYGPSVDANLGDVAGNPEGHFVTLEQG